MRRLRASGIPAFVLTLLMAFGVFLPEVGHSLAHRWGGLHAEHDFVERVGADSAVSSVASSSHAAADHPHLELAATLPCGRPLLAYAVVAQTIFRLCLDIGTGLGPSVGSPPTLAPLHRNHGPPPPTRAPPLV